MLFLFVILWTSFNLSLTDIYEHWSSVCVLVIRRNVSELSTADDFRTQSSYPNLKTNINSFQQGDPKFAKNNQYCERDIVIPLIAISGNILCPVNALQTLFTNSPVPPEYPAFSNLENGKICCITYTSFTKRLKQLLTLCGVNPELYSGHSFRRGGASFLYKLGADPILIKMSGDWLSDSYLRYVSIDLEHRMNAQQIIVSAISS